jgi:benzoylformate decarboxylase
VSATPPATPPTTVRDAVLDLLRQLGMTTVFGNPGSTELAFLDRWPEDFDYVLGLQEASVVAMADGYARAAGRAAFVNLHSAAGLGHALGNIFTAFRNQAPLVITAGQQARALLPNLPFLGATDAAAFPKPYVKFSIEPARATDVPAAIATAYYTAMQHPRGPVFVSIPSDDWSAPCQPPLARRLSWDTAPDPAAIDELADALAAARNPVLVAGPETDQEDAGPALVALAEAIGAPVWTSPFAARLGFPETHPLFAGFLDAAPQAVARTLAPHDLILVIGAPVFTFHVPGDCALFGGDAAIYQLTSDPQAAAAAGAGTTILGSLRLGLPSLCAALPPATRPPPAPRETAAPPAASSPVKAAYLLDRLRQAMPEGAILVEEAPSHRPAMHDHLPVTAWGGFFTMASGGLGYALPAAVGIALAKPGRRVVCLIGDGSLMYSPQALYTAARRRLPLTIIVINNAGYGAMRSFSRVLGVTGVPGIELPGLDFVSLARAMGCPGATITRPETLESALRAALAADGPMLLDVPVDLAIPALYDKH